MPRDDDFNREIAEKLKNERKFLLYSHKKLLNSGEYGALAELMIRESRTTIAAATIVSIAMFGMGAYRIGLCVFSDGSGDDLFSGCLDLALVVLFLYFIRRSMRTKKACCSVLDELKNQEAEQAEIRE